MRPSGTARLMVSFVGSGRSLLVFIWLVVCWESVGVVPGGVVVGCCGPLFWMLFAVFDATNEGRVSGAEVPLGVEDGIVEDVVVTLEVDWLAAAGSVVEEGLIASVIVVLDIMDSILSVLCPGSEEAAGVVEKIAEPLSAVVNVPLSMLGCAGSSVLGVVEVAAAIGVIVVAAAIGVVSSTDSEGGSAKSAVVV